MTSATAASPARSFREEFEELMKGVNKLTEAVQQTLKNASAHDPLHTHAAPAAAEEDDEKQKKAATESEEGTVNKKQSFFKENPDDGVFMRIMKDLIDRILQIINRIIQGIRKALGLKPTDEKKGQKPDKPTQAGTGAERSKDTGVKSKPGALPSPTAKNIASAMMPGTASANQALGDDAEWEVVGGPNKAGVRARTAFGDVEDLDFRQFETDPIGLPSPKYLLPQDSSEDSIAAHTVALVSSALNSRLADPAFIEEMSEAALSGNDEGFSTILMGYVMSDIEAEGMQAKEEIISEVMRILKESGLDEEFSRETARAVTEALPVNLAPQVLAPERAEAVTGALNERGASLEKVLRMNSARGQMPEMIDGTFETLKQKGPQQHPVLDPEFAFHGKIKEDPAGQHQSLGFARPRA